MLRECLIEPSVDVWETMMNLSHVHGDLELGDRCAELVEKLVATRLDKVSSAGLVATKASDFVKEKPNHRSKPCYKFRTEDTSYLEVDLIYETLMSLRSQMQEMGYVPNTRFYRTLILEMENKERVYGYREEVAVVKELLNSKPRSSVFVITNMRICEDCYNILKLITNITGRELIKRDAKRFHFFKNGVCGCNDYW